LIAPTGPKRTGASGAGDIAGSVESRADLGALLDERPALATPALVRALQERVVELHMTDARRAREISACAWLVSERTGDLESRALAHRARALAALASGWQREVLAEYEAAERLYREGGFEVERARVLRSMIDPLMHLGRYEEALEAGRRAREILCAHDRPRLAAQVDTNLANVHHRLGRDAESLDAYERALLFENGRLVETLDDEAMAPIEIQDRKRHEFTCGACMMSLPVETMSSLMASGEITRCVSCGCVLYLEESNREAMTAGKR